MEGNVGAASGLHQELQRHLAAADETCSVRTWSGITCLLIDGVLRVLWVQGATARKPNTKVVQTLWSVAEKAWEECSARQGPHSQSMVTL
jgi:hypothetical protein